MIGNQLRIGNKSNKITSSIHCHRHHLDLDLDLDISATFARQERMIFCVSFVHVLEISVANPAWLWLRNEFEGHCFSRK